MMLFHPSVPWTLLVIHHRDYMRLSPSERLNPPPSAGVWVTPQVPGNFELDLCRAGLLDDPFFGTNIQSLRRFEDCHLFYTCAFDAPACGEEELPVLVFEGIDTFSDICLNGETCLETSNMFLTYELPLPHLKPTGNRLTVHIRPTVIEAQKHPLPPSVGFFDHAYAGLPVRKAASSFGWDILARSVSGGIWRPVRLRTVRAPAIRDLFLYTRSVTVSEDPAVGEAELNLFYALDFGGDTYYPLPTPASLTDGCRLSVEGVCRDGERVLSSFRKETSLWHTDGNLPVSVRDARLWYPKNAGHPFLYEVTVTLLCGDRVLDRRTLRTGIRTVELERTSLAGPDGQFRFLINHRPIFVLGTNWVPLDAFHSRDAARLPHALALLDDIGCNAVRCWGGNVYEDQAFFDFCDEKGILVWQDFAMGCAIYPCDASMCRAIEEEVTFIVRKLRGHPSLCLWAGDNECDLAWWGWHGIPRDPTDNILTRRIIPAVLRAEDFTRPYLPSSPYMDETAVRNGDIDALSENHLWGPRDYFKGEFYRNTTCHFASETGYHGCPAPSSLRAFIPEEELWPIFDEGTDDDPFRGTPHPSYLAHQTSMELNEDNVFGYRIRLMVNQVRTMFRQTPHSADEFARMSQASQAEAMKYFIERFRLSQWRRTGIIWWNLLDGWPQISDAVVGYDFVPKLAYSFIKRAQKPVHLAFGDPENGQIPLVAVNDTDTEERLTVSVRDITGLSTPSDVAKQPPLADVVVTVPPRTASPLFTLPSPPHDRRFLLIRWTDRNGQSSVSHFIAEPKELDSDTYFRCLALAGEDDFHGFREMPR